MTKNLSIQLSALDNDRNNILSLVVKRTYAIKADGKCVLDEDQIPLTEDISFYEDSPKLLKQDIDINALKLYTDIIVKGNGYNPAKSNRFSVAVQIARLNINISVIGNRTPYLSNSGKICFTEPELIESIPLRYDFAYGGKDIVGEEGLGSPPPDIAKLLPKDTDFHEGNLFRYPRNPLGKGYLVNLTKRSIELTELPNLEDPDDLLTEGNLVSGAPEKWINMPLPSCTDWINPTWFPRVAYFGVFGFPPYMDQKIKEIKRGYLKPEILLLKPFSGQTNLQCNNGASPGFQIPYIKPGEKCRLVNMHPKFSDFVFQLPAESPKIWIDGRKGKLIPTIPVIHTVTIEPDENRVSIVWRGSGPALRKYFDEELKSMPYKITWD